MLLIDKNAIIYGAAGSLGSAIAKGFAKEGARLFLAGRTLAPLEEIAKEIIANGGMAEIAAVDALDEKAVKVYVDTIMQKHGHVDISFNAMATDDFMRPLQSIMQSQFITASAAAKHMIKQSSGVYFFLLLHPPASLTR